MRNSLKLQTSGLLLAVGTSIGLASGVLLTLAVSTTGPTQSVVEIPLHATASDTGEMYAMATAWFSDNMEGLFVLDFRTGNLTLDVLNIRDGKKPGARYATNVVKDLGVEEGKASYLMVTAETKFIFPKAAAAEPSRSVVYVMDQNTGRWVAYGFFWNPAFAHAGTFQKGLLEALYAGTARPVDLE